MGITGCILKTIFFQQNSCLVSTLLCPFKPMLSDSCQDYHQIRAWRLFCGRCRWIQLRPGNDFAWALLLNWGSAQRHIGAPHCCEQRIFVVCNLLLNRREYPMHLIDVHVWVSIYTSSTHSLWSWTLFFFPSFHLLWSNTIHIHRAFTQTSSCPSLLWSTVSFSKVQEYSNLRYV